MPKPMAPSTPLSNMQRQATAQVAAVKKLTTPAIKRPGNGLLSTGRGMAGGSMNSKKPVY